MRIFVIFKFKKKRLNLFGIQDGAGGLVLGFGDQVEDLFPVADLERRAGKYGLTLFVTQLGVARYLMPRWRGSGLTARWAGQ